MTEISKIISYKTGKIYILGFLVCLSVEQSSRLSPLYGTEPVRNSTGNSSVCKFYDQVFLRRATTDFFLKWAKINVFFLPNGSPRSHTSLGSKNLRAIIEMPLFPMWQTYWHWYYGWQCPKFAHEKRKAQVRNDNDWMSA